MLDSGEVESSDNCPSSEVKDCHTCLGIKRGPTQEMDLALEFGVLGVAQLVGGVSFLIDPRLLEPRVLLALGLICKHG